MACAPWDAACFGDAFLGRLTDGFAEMSWNLVKSAFLGSASTITDGQWDLAAAFTNRFAAIMTIFTVIVALIQLVRAAIAGDMRRAAQAGLGALLAWPVTALSVWFAIKATGAMDYLVVEMLGSQTTKNLAPLFSINPSNALAGPNGAAGALLPSLLLLLVFWVFSLVLSMTLIFRNFALVVLVAFGPVALMLMAWETSRAWAKVWFQSVLALIIAKPLAAAILLLAAQLVGDTKDLSGPEAIAPMITALVAIVLACAAPAASLALLRFTGASSAHDDGDQGRVALAGVGTKAARGGSGLMRGLRAVKGMK